MGKYTDEYRRETADYIISTGRPAAVVARELGINEKTAGRWVTERKREKADPAAYAAARAEDAEVRELRRRNRELEMENAFLKKAAAFFAKGQA